ncbi:MAG: hypothetical protein LBT09_01595 [Planctomycetaceae bacterium]|jgi:membrane-anchored protein YejM (alkaline phosphatase superfamily)|nr:hypothetical protein [Planctomycetaceae bacterium]
MHAQSQNLICVSIDGLHNGMIGAYGNSWIQTPTFDQLAAQASVFDRYYAASVKLADNFDLLWRDTWLDQFSQNNGKTILVTDDSDIFNHTNAHFERKYMFEVPKDKVAAAAEDTLFFKIFATIIDLASDCIRNEPNRRYCIWAHLCGFRSCWDFPLFYRRLHRGEEDPGPYKNFRLPLFNTFNPDKLQSVIESYSGGVSLLDEVLSGLLESLESGEVGVQTVLAVFGVRGFALGEHKMIGASYDLFDENIHLPLFVRLPDNTGATVRVADLLNPSDLSEFFIALAKNQINNAKITQLMKENKTEKHKSIQIKGKNNEIALVLPDWFVRRCEEQISVYVKPDDRWEVNDVANRLNENSEINSILKEL